MGAPAYWHDSTGERHDDGDAPGWAVPGEPLPTHCERGFPISREDRTCCVTHDRIPTDRTPARGLDLVRIQKHRLRREREAREAARAAELAAEAAVLIPLQAVR